MATLIDVATAYRSLTDLSVELERSETQLASCKTSASGYLEMLGSSTIQPGSMLEQGSAVSR
jgi:hypothetical protein